MEFLNSIELLFCEFDTTLWHIKRIIFIRDLMKIISFILFDYTTLKYCYFKNNYSFFIDKYVVYKTILSVIYKQYICVDKEITLLNVFR